MPTPSRGSIAALAPRSGRRRDRYGTPTGPRSGALGEKSTHHPRRYGGNCAQEPVRLPQDGGPVGPRWGVKAGRGVADRTVGEIHPLQEPNRVVLDAGRGALRVPFVEPLVLSQPVLIPSPFAFDTGQPRGEPRTRIEDIGREGLRALPNTASHSASWESATTSTYAEDRPRRGPSSIEAPSACRVRKIASPPVGGTASLPSGRAVGIESVVGRWALSESPTVAIRLGASVLPETARGTHRSLGAGPVSRTRPTMRRFPSSGRWSRPSAQRPVRGRTSHGSRRSIPGRRLIPGGSPGRSRRPSRPVAPRSPRGRSP